MMERREADALDRHITGNYGEDQFTDEPDCTCTTRCDDGLLWDGPPETATEIVDRCDCRACHSPENDPL